MINQIHLFIQQLLTSGNFKSTDISAKDYKALLTAFDSLKRIDTVFIPQLIKLAKKLKANCQFSVSQY